MKKIATLISSILFFTCAGMLKTNAQWNLQSPIPTGLHLYAPYFITPSHGFIAGINHLLLETTDGGASWIERMSDEYGSDPFYDISFAGDGLTGFITGNSTTIQKDLYRTTDGGVTWTVMNNFPLGGSWNLIDIISPTKVFFGSNGGCAYSSNAGSTWTLKSGSPNCPTMYGMDFRDEQVGLVCGNLQGSEGIFKTTNGGTTWTKKSSVSCNDVLWWTNDIAFAASGTSIYRSTNQGDTWSLYASGISTGLLEMEKVDNVTLAGVSAKGDVWRSTNEGLTWTQVLDGPGDLPVTWSLKFTDALHGWMVGQSGFIYTSNDGGLTWLQISNGMGAQVNDLSFVTSNFGMGVGVNGYVFKTTNGGSLWSVQKLEVTGQIFGRDESLNAISLVDESFAVVAGPGGTVFRTSDGGLTWESIGYPELPGSFWIEDVKFVDHNTGWLVGQDLDLGHEKSVYKTINGGDTWTLAMSQNSYMFATDFVDAQHGWIATIGSLYFRTTDGNTWISGNYPAYFTSPTVSDIDFADQNNGWAIGWDGFVARSTNGGVSWTLQNLGTTEEHFFSINVVSATEAWITGRQANLPMNGVVYHTTNGGTSWVKESSAPAWPYYGYVITANSGNVWIGGFEGHIYKKQGAGCIAPAVAIAAAGATTFCNGESLTITGTATGTPGTYQWKMNGNNLAGQTSNAYAASASGTYTVVVTNGCGTATSNAIAVTVKKNPKATVTPSGTVSMCAGEDTLLSANTGNNLGYQWLKNGIAINGATGSTYLASNAGKYSVEVTNTPTTCSKVSTAAKIKINCKGDEAGAFADSEYMEVYPNPSADAFMLQLNDGAAYDIEVYDVLGRKIKEYPSVTNSLNFGNDFLPGTYLLQVSLHKQIMKVIRLVKTSQ